MKRARFFFCILVSLLYSTQILAQSSETNQITTVEQLIQSKNSYLPIAKKLFERITGMKIRASDGRIHQMALSLQKGDLQAAALIALQDPAFINVRTRNFAIRLSNKAFSPGQPFNDSAALIAGIIRDDFDFREVLTASYRYELKSSSQFENRYQMSIGNTQFAELDSLMLDLNSGLEKKEGHIIGKSYEMGVINKIVSNTTLTAAQKTSEINSKGIETASHPDPAGILTTRFFAEKQLSGGSNRRAVEYVANAFLCSTLSDIGNNMASDAYVGKDVDRFPGGSYEAYTNNCKSCHTVMDGFRGAFAKSNYANYSADQIGGSGIAHGSFAAESTDSRNKWLAEIFNGGVLAAEVVAKMADSTLAQNIKTATASDWFVKVTAAVIDDAAILKAREDKANLQIGNMTTGATDAIKNTARNLAFKFHKILQGQNLSPQVWRALAADATLKAELKITASNTTLTKANFPINWQTLETSFSLLYANGDQIIADANLEVRGAQVATLRSIRANPALSINVEKYSEKCLTLIVNTVESTGFVQFLNCEFELNKLNSFIGLHLVARATQNRAPAEYIRGLKSAITTRNIQLSTTASNMAREFWYSYLRAQEKMRYFNNLGFDTTTGVHNKMNAGAFVAGYNVKDDTFVNLASSSFGWRGSHAAGGKGLRDFGDMISNSETFSRCMVKRIYKDICYQDISTTPTLHKSLAVAFENGGYKIRTIIGKIATTPECGIIKGENP